MSVVQPSTECSVLMDVIHRVRINLLKSIKLRSVRHTWLLTLTAILLAVLAFGGALLELVHRWSRQEEYSHGFLIPILVAWLIWMRRDALRAAIGQPSWIGIGAILIALAMHIAGEFTALFILSHIGFVIALSGIVLVIGGYSLLKVVAIPVTFLIFAIPLPYFIDTLLTSRLQLISSELGASFIRAFGIPVYLDGNIIDLGNYKLQVVEACSGLRYLYPLLSLSFLASYLFQAPLWQRAFVFLSGIPIAIGMNGFRIGLVGVLVDRWGISTADGALHFFEGWMIFLACTTLLAAESYLLVTISGGTFFHAFHFPNISANSLCCGHKSGSFDRTPLATCLILLCTGGLTVPFITGRSEAIQERARFVEFPGRIGQWQAYPSLLDLETAKKLALDDYILSDYSQPDGKAVSLYIAYYASQRKGESPHSPIVCIPGSGWTITQLQEISYGKLGEEHPLNRAVIEKGADKQLVYYWFDERGRKIASEWWAKLYLLADAFLKNRTDGALIRLTTRIAPGEDERAAEQRLQLFMKDAVPKLSRFLPADTTLLRHRPIAGTLRGRQS
jgi:exosortase D (VPLPA-CTERM-specific)